MLYNLKDTLSYFNSFLFFYLGRYWFDINLSKKFLKDRLSVSVFANDIFNQNRTRLQSIFGNVNIANNTDSRNLGFTITYKIPTKNKLAKEDPNLINNQEKKDDNGGLIPQGQ